MVQEAYGILACQLANKIRITKASVSPSYSLNHGANFTAEQPVSPADCI